MSDSEERPDHGWIAALRRRLSPKRLAGRRPPPEADMLDAHAEVAGQLADPCFLLDGDGRVRYQNPAAIDLFGSIAPGQPLSFLLRAPELAEVLQSVRETGDAARVTYSERVPIERWFEARAAPLPAPGADTDSPGRLLLVLRDLTESQRVERMRGDFVANVSHELRTPLASLSGFIETLQGSAREDPQARARFLDIMQEQAWRMSRLIDDLMSLSRIELKQHVRPETLIDLTVLLGHVAEAMEPVAGESGVALHTDLPEAALMVAGDRDELAQVFQNLVHNAVKYGGSGGRIDITAARRPGGDAGRPERIAVSVRDYGPGIPAEHVPRLTERFYRVDKASSREKGGTGLGLAIVKHIVSRHRGELRIDSAPGDGATFTVTLEAADGT